MEPKTKEAFDIVIAVLKKDRTLFDKYPHADRGSITVSGMCDVACNHLFDDHPELFGITKMQGHIIRAYFHNVERNVYINELHELAPDFFQAETVKD